MKKENKHDFNKNFLNSRRNLPYLIILGVLCFIIFANSLSNDFIKWDDNEYVTENIHIEDLSFPCLKNMFQVYVSCHYHPMTLLSLALDYHFWGYEAKGYILTNIILHLCNTLLAFLIFFKLTKNRKLAFLTALIFSIHPLRVESVVWISERKDVLYMFFYLGAMMVYIHYLDGKFKIKYLLIAFGLFLLSLFSKASAVTLPLVLLAFDFYKERKDYKHMVVEKVPFFVLSFVFGLLALDAQSSAIPNIFPVYEHLFLATYALAFYLFKFFIPLHLSAITPFPDTINEFLPLKYYLSFFILPFLIVLPYIFRKHFKTLVFGLLIFFIPLLPVLIKFPIGPAYLAERYTYLSHLALSFLLAYCYNIINEKYTLKNNLKNPAFLLIMAFIVFLSFMTIQRNKVWQNNQTLFEDVIEKDTGVAIAHLNLGNTFLESSRYQNAINSYNNAIRLSRDLIEAYEGRGLAFFNSGDFVKAIDDFSVVLLNDSHNIQVLLSRAQSYVNIFQFEKAIVDLDNLLLIAPDNAQALNNRGAVYYNMGRPIKALNDFQRAIEIDSTNPMAFFNRAMLMEQMNNYQQAFNDYSRCIQLNASLYQAHNARGVLRGRYMNDLEGALEDVNAALMLKPEMMEALKNRAYIYFLKGNIDAACTDWQSLIQKGDTSVAGFIDGNCL
ncbi:MAG: tetratricopeptide repeat protein [Bacteroidales bacterium]|nr:tetratricopeptide repeat protein [Bacteroidales bacterium]